MTKKQPPVHQSNDKDNNGENIEVWEDIVNIKDLILSIAICTITTLGGYLIAPDDSSKQLMFGLIGVVVGFAICSIIIKPKRTITYVDEEN
ncbi:hypothetical protein CIL05_05260 [Virgibacillus profundi]|uniref:Heme ABC transporter n=1 Tax=Virgibacillus profundi TaxID=2024555 RepID=A0A2A2IG36_9BACI|nr:hypothetical protein [Virgibacillus profundi]PAV30512.1 hypothetical protein CIL05_05260 [Virgibacillus profundi]PXY54684.1 hypothetical protein CIT14_05345 [Virgibacillus profundi]